MPNQNPFQSQQMLMRALALEKAKGMAIRDLEMEKLIAMSASERNRLLSVRTNVYLYIYPQESKNFVSFYSCLHNVDKTPLLRQRMIGWRVTQQDCGDSCRG